MSCTRTRCHSELCAGLKKCYIPLEQSTTLWDALLTSLTFTPLCQRWWLFPNKLNQFSHYELWRINGAFFISLRKFPMAWATPISKLVTYLMLCIYFRCVSTFLEQIRWGTQYAGKWAKILVQTCIYREYLRFEVHTLWFIWRLNSFALNNE